VKKNLNVAAIVCFLIALALCAAAAKTGHGIMHPFHGFSSGA
jgi:hypothetical protein